MENGKEGRGHRVLASITQLMIRNLTKFYDKHIDKILCYEVYQTVFETAVDVFQQSNITLTNEAMNFLAQMFYDFVDINGKQLDPDIFTQRASLANIETKELAFLATMFEGTDISLIFISEIRRRS
jgi:hypothetical protein